MNDLLPQHAKLIEASAIAPAVAAAAGVLTITELLRLRREPEVRA